MFLLENDNIVDEVALQLETDAYQSDFNEDDFFKFYLCFQRNWKFSFTFWYQFHNSFSFFKCSFGEWFNNGTG